MFEIALSVDADYLFTRASRRVVNKGTEPVSVHPWARIRRDYTPKVAGYYILHEGLLGMLGGRLKEVTYSGAKSDGAKAGGVAMEVTAPGGWAGITDKYWLTALVPDQQAGRHQHVPPPDGEQRRPLPGGFPAPRRAAGRARRGGDGNDPAVRGGQGGHPAGPV